MITFNAAPLLIAMLGTALYSACWAHFAKEPYPLFEWRSTLISAGFVWALMFVWTL